MGLEKAHRFTRVCKDCGEVFVTYKKRSKTCLECKDMPHLTMYFNKFPEGLEMTSQERRFLRKVKGRTHKSSTIRVKRYSFGTFVSGGEAVE